MLLSEQDVAREDNRRVTDKQVVGSPLKLFLQTQERLGAFEEHLDFPAHPVNPDDLLGRHRDAGDKLSPNQAKDVAVLTFDMRRSCVQRLQATSFSVHVVAFDIVLHRAEHAAHDA